MRLVIILGLIAALLLGWGIQEYGTVRVLKEREKVLVQAAAERQAALEKALKADVQTAGIKRAVQAQVKSAGDLARKEMQDAGIQDRRDACAGSASAGVLNDLIGKSNTIIQSSR